MVKLISIDPGIYKCGLLLVDLADDTISDGRIVLKEYVLDLLSLWHKENLIDQIIIGNGTSSDYWFQKLLENKYRSLYLSNEKNTTMRARFRYWEIWPPKKIFRFIPKSILLPADDLDPVAALVIVEDYLKRKLVWPSSRIIRTWPE